MAKKDDKEGGKKKERKNSVAKAIYALFDECGIDKVSFEKAERTAKIVKKDTAFNAQHFSWYKNQYRKAKGIKSVRGKGKSKGDDKD